MTKSARDMLALYGILTQPSQPVKYKEEWTRLSIGFGDPTIWNMWESVCPQHEGTAEQMVNILIAPVGALLIFCCRKMSMRRLS
jgi:amidase